MRQWCLTLFAGYRDRILPFLKPACPVAPTCSEYASAAISRYGLLRGRKLATGFLLKCFPFHLVGLDSVK